MKFNKKVLKSMKQKNPRIAQQLRTLRLCLNQNLPIKGGLGERLKDVKVEANSTVDISEHGIYAFVKEAEAVYPAPDVATAAKKEGEEYWETVDQDKNDKYAHVAVPLEAFGLPSIDSNFSILNNEDEEKR